MRCLDVFVADLGDVQQAAHAADVDEGAVGLDATHGAEHHFAHLEAIHLALHQGAAMAEHQAVALLVHLQELEGQEVCHELFLGLAGADVAAGDEAAQAFHPHQGTTTVGGEHLGVDGGVFLLQLAHPLPGALVLDAADRERELAVFVLLTHDEELADLAGLQHVAEALHPVDRHLLQGHECRCFGADIDHGALRFQGEDGAVDDVTRLEVVVVLAQQGGKFIQREARSIEVAACSAAARFICAGNLFRDCEVGCCFSGEIQIQINLGGTGFGSGHGHGMRAVCRGQDEMDSESHRLRPN